MVSVHYSVPDLPHLWAAGILWIPGSILAVSLRFYARKTRNAPFMMDDWLTVPAAAFTVGICIAFIYGISIKGVGYPTPVPPPGQDPLTFRDKQIIVVKQLVWTMSLLQCLGLTCTKLSCLLFYRRVFNIGCTRYFNIITRTAIAIVLCWGITFFFAILFWCRTRISAWWTNIQDLSRYCPASLDVELAYAATDVFTDLMVILIPVRPLLQLKMSTTRKLAVVGVFGMGLLCLAASVVRLVIYLGAVLGLKQSYKAKGANNSATTAGLYWDVMELGLSLVGVCLPTIHSLLSSAMKSRNSTSSSGSGGTRQTKFQQGQLRIVKTPMSRLMETSASSEQDINPILGLPSSEAHSARVDSSSTIAGEEGQIRVTKTYDVREYRV